MSIDSARSQWTPPPGRHQVGMGGSMARFLKQRKGIQQTKQNKAMPTSNFYQFKCAPLLSGIWRTDSRETHAFFPRLDNFMPESVDTSKPGVVELATKDITHVRVERASQQVSCCGLRSESAWLTKVVLSLMKCMSFAARKSPRRR